MSDADHPNLSAKDVSAEVPGTVSGRYKLLDQIGEGGFGVVFMAEQEEPVRRKVALKVIKAGMDSRRGLEPQRSQRAQSGVAATKGLSRKNRKTMKEGQVVSFAFFRFFRPMKSSTICVENLIAAGEQLGLLPCKRFPLLCVLCVLCG